MAILIALAVAAVVVVEEDGSPRREAPIPVPRARAVAIDGIVDEAEWRGSVIVRRRDGEMLLRHDGKYLYIGVRSARHGVPNICLRHGNTVRVMRGVAMGNPRHAEMQIPFDQLDVRNPRIAVAFFLEDADRGEEIADGSRARARNGCANDRLARGYGPEKSASSKKSWTHVKLR